MACTHKNVFKKCPEIVTACRHMHNVYLTAIGLRKFEAATDICWNNLKCRENTAAIKISVLLQL